MLEKMSKINLIKIYQVDLNSPRQELSNGGLGIAVALLVRWQIDCLCACHSSAIQP